MYSRNLVTRRQRTRSLASYLLSNQAVVGFIMILFVTGGIIVVYKTFVG